MDRDLYHAHQDTIRLPSVKIIVCIGAAYYTFMAKVLLDCSDAFQTTRTDGPDSTEPPFYVWPPAGQQRVSEHGEVMCLQILVYMQGRIDACLLYTSDAADE